jgi:hypothetical protein
MEVISSIGSLVRKNTYFRRKVRYHPRISCTVSEKYSHQSFQSIFNRETNRSQEYYVLDHLRPLFQGRFT